MIIDQSNLCILCENKFTEKDEICDDCRFLNNK